MAGQQSVWAPDKVICSRRHVCLKHMSAALKLWGLDSNMKIWESRNPTPLRWTKLHFIFFVLRFSCRWIASIACPEFRSDWGESEHEWFYIYTACDFDRLVTSLGCSAPLALCQLGQAPAPRNPGTGQALGKKKTLLMDFMLDSLVMYQRSRWACSNLDIKKVISVSYGWLSTISRVYLASCPKSAWVGASL